jgi:hypothetical protein
MKDPAKPDREKPSLIRDWRLRLLGVVLLVLATPVGLVSREWMHIVVLIWLAVFVVILRWRSLKG